MAKYSKPQFGPWVAAILGLCALSVVAARLWRSNPASVRVASPRAVAVGQSDDRADEPLAEPRLAQQSAEPKPLERYESPRFFAPTAPPVADVVAPVLAAAEEAIGLPPVPEYEPAAALVATRAPRAYELPQEIPLSVPRQAVVPQPVRTSWPRPEALLAQLDNLEAHAPCKAWVERVRKALERIEQAPALGSPEVADVLTALEQAAREGEQLVEFSEHPAAHSEARRAALAIQRRVDIWRRVHELTHDERTLVVTNVDRDLRELLAKVERQMGPPQPEERAREWREFLLLDTLRLVSSSDPFDAESARTLARRVLNRMSAPTLTEAQREFLEQPEFVALADRLRMWAYEPIDYVKFLAEIEDCELRLAEGRSGLVKDWQMLRWSPWQQTAELADRIDAYYRNANLRIAISGDMLNRLLPEVHVVEEDVHDQILGARVQGRSMTFARLFVVLIPDRLNWRMGLVARGQVDSRTRSAKGPVTFFNTGATRYRVRKMLTINRRGIELQDAEAEAENFTRLTNVATDFDGLPLVGSLVRSIAIREHNDRAPQANAQVEFKVGSRAAERLDEEVHRKLLEAQQRYEEQLLEPLRRLYLNPVALEMQTTDERLIVRYRVAANHQLAANTPRPQAPVDSLLSVQLHESTLNNIIGQLQLAGRKLTLPQLVAELAEAARRPDIELPDDVPDDIEVEFAAVDPIRVRFADDHVRLSLRIASLRAGRRVCRDFEVHTRYAPVAIGREVWLARGEDDYVELRGERLNFRDRGLLRGIFNTMLARERKLPLFGPTFAQHPKLADVGVTQLVLHDGWLGLALGPWNSRVAGREATTR